MDYGGIDAHKRASQIRAGWRVPAGTFYWITWGP